MDYKYKVGDRVRVRYDLDVQKRYKMVSGPNPGFDPGISADMLEYIGKTAIVSKCDTVYDLEGCRGFVWSDEMIEPVKQLCCKSLL